MAVLGARLVSGLRKRGLKRRTMRLSPRVFWRTTLCYPTAVAAARLGRSNRTDLNSLGARTAN